MAGNNNSGRLPTFAIPEKDLEKRIAEYKQAVADGQILHILFELP